MRFFKENKLFTLALFIAISVVGVAIWAIPALYWLYFIAVGSTLFLINLWLVAFCNASIERKYEEKFDVFWRMLIMLIMTISWAAILYYHLH